MLFHQNEKCPVCDKKFNENDDIVICPSCGAPHHRACYHSLGRCFYSDKHAYDFSYTPLIGDADGRDHFRTDCEKFVKNQNGSETVYRQNQIPQTKFCRKCGTRIESNVAFCPECGEKQADAQYNFVPPAMNFGANNSQQNEYARSTEDINGKSLADISATVVTNSPRFINKFRSGKKTSWNWGAFVFGAYYFFFRKMYKEGLIAAAVRLIVTFILQGVYSSDIYTYVDCYNAFLDAFSKTKSIEGLEAEIAAVTEASYHLIPMLLITLASVLVIHIICAVFADAFYKKRVFGIIEKVDKALNDGDGIDLSSVFPNETNISDEQMRWLFLGKTGGTNIFAPVMIYCAINIILNYIPQLL